jgi:hypothetical protein
MQIVGELSGAYINSRPTPLEYKSKPNSNSCARRVMSNEECVRRSLCENARAKLRGGRAACGKNIALVIYKRAFQLASQMFGCYGSIKCIYINPALCNFQLNKSAAHNARTVEAI